MAMFDTYRRDFVDRSRDAGLEAARRGDPDGFEEACQIVLQVLREQSTVCADDVRPRLRRGSPTTLGAVFGSLKRDGLIEPDGVTIARAPSRHGSLQRIWRSRGSP